MLVKIDDKTQHFEDIPSALEAMRKAGVDEVDIIPERPRARTSPWPKMLTIADVRRETLVDVRHRFVALSADEFLDWLRLETECG